jgi:hypothetical protein
MLEDLVVQVVEVVLLEVLQVLVIFILQFLLPIQDQHQDKDFQVVQVLVVDFMVDQVVVVLDKQVKEV